jgi:hypothetical protein
VLAKLDGERQPDIAQADDADLAIAQTEFRHGSEVFELVGKAKDATKMRPKQRPESLDPF